MEESDSTPVKTLVVNAKVPAKGKKVKEVMIPSHAVRQYMEEQVSEEEASTTKASTPLVSSVKKGGRIADEDEPIIPTARVVQKPL